MVARGIGASKETLQSHAPGELGAPMHFEDSGRPTRRETYKLTGDTLEHTFELAAPGKPFERYTAATLKRQKQ